MRTSRLLLIAVVLAVLAGQAKAGIIFGRKSPPKHNPAERVMELIGTVKTDPDERKRAAAAEELRHFDPTMFPDIVPVLIDVLRTDPKPSVRSEAVQSLAKLRPVSQVVGRAIEQAVQQDSSMRVRLQARSSLLLYHWAGYSSKPRNGATVQSKEPPLAMPAEQIIPLSPDTPSPSRLVPAGKESSVPPLFPPEPVLQRVPAHATQGPELLPNN